MKVTDLMVGDWVNIKGKSVKVTLDDLRMMLILFEDVDFHIDPIPLTDDILVKNGFGKVNNQYFFGQVEIKELRDCWVVTINKEDADIDINIHYVHTLQHLLRLAGVQKEIEL